MKKRIISAIVMILIVLPLIVFGGLYLKIGTVVLGACSMYELLKQKNNMPLFIKIISIISVMLVIYFSNSFSIFSNLYFFPILFLLFLSYHFEAVLSFNFASSSSKSGLYSPFFSSLSSTNGPMEILFKYSTFLPTASAILFT